MQRSSGEHVLLQSATSESHLCVGRASARARWHADARARGRAGASVRACGRVCFASSLCACVCVSHLGPLAVVIAVGEVVQPSHVHLDETSGARVQSLFILFYFILFSCCYLHLFLGGGCTRAYCTAISIASSSHQRLSHRAISTAAHPWVAIHSAVRLRNRLCNLIGLRL